MPFTYEKIQYKKKQVTLDLALCDRHMMQFFVLSDSYPTIKHLFLHHFEGFLAVASFILENPRVIEKHEN